MWVVEVVELTQQASTSWASQQQQATHTRDSSSRSPQANQLTFSTGEWDRPAPMPMTPQVSTPPRPWVEKQEPNTDSILSSRIMQDSSRHRLDMAIALSPVKPYAASAISRRAMKSSTPMARGKCLATSTCLEVVEWVGWRGGRGVVFRWRRAGEDSLTWRGCSWARS